ncbi:glucose dehydrogenase [FAD, quinone]-like isoform X1 [Diabrotica virgifera virgifera]|uniref:Glucose dehydrogenase [FAD, quinone]-like isoform X1 n=1 Tax=Diabrotica virgifera virgifera TaxID=50390 RepID=A0A6P7G6M3_DIAVI|nr:glucose dehydrogenase [FAD, quinone]-like isoform X1 [Diabrotica virgifera virgifera]
MTKLILFVSVILAAAVSSDGGIIQDILGSVNSKYDFIVIGAGSAGSVVANRLSANPNWTVLALEAGINENFLNDIPITAWFQSKYPYDWGFKTEKQPNACLSTIDGTCLIANGKAVGGTSVTNFMVYNRGNKEDYNEWAALGNNGWSYDDVLPFFKKSENCEKCTDIDAGYHSNDGPLNIEPPGWESPLVDLFIKAGEELGYSQNDPDGKEQLGFSKIRGTERRGRRCSTATAFIKPILNRSNFNLQSGARVTKILIDPTTKKAHGVEYIKYGIKHTVHARKEIILSAGTIMSPQLLMTSGVGPQDHLTQKGITCLKDSKVGYNLQDHIGVVFQALFVNESVTFTDADFFKPQNWYEYLVNGKGVLTLPGGSEAVAFVKSKYADQNLDYPDLQLVLGAISFNQLTFAIMGNSAGVPTKLYNQVFAPHVGTPSFGINPFVLRPKSRGRVSLRTSNSLDNPIIAPNYFSQTEDVDVLVEGLKMAIQIAESDPFKRYNTRPNKSPFPTCEALEFGSDEYWKCAIRQVAMSGQNHVGTCKMGPSTDGDAVVDPSLKVHGIDGLRVADASIMPNVVAGNIFAAVVMIGEKAADMIAKDWSV